jgi:hypothetical protein
MVSLKMNYRFIFVSICFMFSTYVFSIDLSAPLHALKNKEYEKSLQLYQQIETQGYQGADMYQNMAIASSAIGKDVEAIIYLEKALKYKPENQELTQLLSATLKRNSKIEKEEPKPIIFVFLNKLTGVFLPSIWIVLSLLCLLFIGWFFYSGFSDRIWINTYKIKLGLVLTSFVLFTLLARYRHYQLYNQNTIIITSEQTILKVSPDEESPDVSELVAGSKVYYKDKINDWWLISTVYGEEGWIKSSHGQRL